VIAAAFTDAELLRRAETTLLACWDEYARGAPGAVVHRLPGVAAAVFPAGPERSVYNNAVLARRLAAPAREAALDAMEAAYERGGVEDFAAWVHESDRPMRAALERRGYAVAETTRAMSMSLDRLSVPRPEVDLGTPAWEDYLRTFDLPAGLLAGADHTAFGLGVVRRAGQDATASLTYDFRGDRGIYNVATVPRHRRVGLATALTAWQLHDARDRGLLTASLQATPMAERMYAGVGFRDLGRIVEYRRLPS
jgi:GNAT superfamily N-acetyltransferase